MSGADHSKPVHRGGAVSADSGDGGEDVEVSRSTEEPGPGTEAEFQAGKQEDPGTLSDASPRRAVTAAAVGDGDETAVDGVTDRGAEDLDGASAPAQPASRGRRGRRGIARGNRGRRGSFARELPVLVLVAFVLALIIKAFLVQAFWIPTVSMERTLLVNDRVLVNKLVYRFRDVHRGEIVVFNGDGTGFERAETVITPPSNVFSRALRSVQGMLGLGAPSDKDFIKRVIGVGGDTVMCCDAQGRVLVNGRPLDEPYVYENSPVGAGREFAQVTVPPGQLWVMGDHRSESSDSRVNGTIPQSKVVGRAFVRVWPLDRMAFLSPPDIFAAVPRAIATTVPPAGAGVLGAAGVTAGGVTALRRLRGVSGGLSPRSGRPPSGRNTGEDRGDGGPARPDDSSGRSADRSPNRRRRHSVGSPPAVHADQRGDPT